MKFSFSGRENKNQFVALRAGGIVAVSLFIAFTITPVFAQTNEDIMACLAQGGNPVTNIDCGFIGGGTAGNGYAYTCYYCELPPSCQSQGLSGTQPNCYTTPPSCTADLSCAATTCAGSNCNGTNSSCQTVTVAGTKSCTPPPTTCADLGQVGTFPACTTPPPVYAEASYVPAYTQASYTPSYSQSTYYSEASYAPVGCGTPSATLTAAPTRVRSGQTSTLTLTATGVTTSCSITGPGVNTTVAASSCGVSKTLVTPAITSQSTYTVTCDGVASLAKIIVNLVARVIEF